MHFYFFDVPSSKFGTITVFGELIAKFFVTKQSVYDAVKKDVADVDRAEDFSDLCTQFRLIKCESYTKGMNKYAPVLMTALSPMMKKTNN